MSAFDFNSFSGEVRGKLQSRNLKAGEILFEEGDPVEQMYFCQTGCVRLEVYPESGKSLVLYRAKADEAFAEEHLMLDNFTYRATADQKSTVVFAPKADLLNDILMNPKIAFTYVQCLIRRLYNLRINFERIGIKSAKGRILHLLRTLQLQSGSSIDLSGKVKSLSDDLNLSHEAMYRGLRELEGEGVLTRKDGVIHMAVSSRE